MIMNCIDNAVNPVKRDFCFVFVGLNGMNSSIWEHFPTGQSSPGTPPALLSTGSMYAEASRLKQEVEEAHRVLKHWDHSWRQMAQVRLHLCVFM